jgi:hypothetical protein
MKRIPASNERTAYLMLKIDMTTGHAVGWCVKSEPPWLITHTNEHTYAILSQATGDSFGSALDMIMQSAADVWYAWARELFGELS